MQNRPQCNRWTPSDPDPARVGAPRDASAVASDRDGGIGGWFKKRRAKDRTSRDGNPTERPRWPAVNEGLLLASTPTEGGNAAIIKPVAQGEPEGALVLTSFTQPARGIVQRNTDDTLTYRPDGDFAGFDHFEYTLTDEAGTLFPATVTVEVAMTDGPTSPDLRSAREQFNPKDDDEDVLLLTRPVGKPRPGGSGREVGDDEELLLIPQKSLSPQRRGDLPHEPQVRRRDPDNRPLERTPPRRRSPETGRPVVRDETGTTDRPSGTPVETTPRTVPPAIDPKRPFAKDPPQPPRPEPPRQEPRAQPPRDPTPEPPTVPPESPEAIAAPEAIGPSRGDEATLTETPETDQLGEPVPKELTELLPTGHSLFHFAQAVQEIGPNAERDAKKDDKDRKD